MAQLQTTIISGSLTVSGNTEIDGFLSVIFFIRRLAELIQTIIFKFYSKITLPLFTS